MTASRGPAALVIVLLAGFGLRLWWSGALTADPALFDPDGYTGMARALLDGDGQWRWDFEAVEYAEFTKAPLYQTVLSILLRVSSVVPFPQSALFLHAALHTATIAMIYIVGCTLRSQRTGMVAATAYAFWLPNIFVSQTFWQEHLYIPLIMAAFAVTARATEKEGSGAWLLAGATFGLAALTRSTIAYFIPAAVLILLFRGGPRRLRLAAAAALLGGFVAVTAPYIAYISGATGRFTVIESIGYFSLKRGSSTNPVRPGVDLLSTMADPSGPPTSGEALRFIYAEWAADPPAFASRRLEYLRMLLKPSGGSLLANTLVPTRAAAAAVKAAVHAVIDLPWAAAVIVAPFGLLAARGRLLAALLATWALLHVGSVAGMLWAGTRFRSPIEPAAILLAAAVLAHYGGWRASRLAVTGALAASAAAAWLVLASAPGVLALRPSYGIDRPLTREQPLIFTSEIGTYVTCLEPALRIFLEPAGTTPTHADVTVLLNGRLADRFVLGSERILRRYPLPSAGTVYLEVRVAGSPFPIHLGLD